MAVEPIVLGIYSALVSWTYLLLAILIIAKLIQTMSGGIGGGDGWKWPWKKGKDDDDASESTRRKSKNSKDGAGADTKSNSSKEGLDTANPAKVKVVVVDEDDNPLQGAVVNIVPARMWKRVWGMFKTKKNWRQYGGVTGPDGGWPSMGSYHQVGSGTIRISVVKDDFTIISRLVNGASVETNTDYELKPMEQYDIVVTMKLKGEKAELFEPKILGVVDKDSETMAVRGVVR